MPFTDQQLAQQVGFLVLKLWETNARCEDLQKLIPVPPAPTPEAAKE